MANFFTRQARKAKNAAFDTGSYVGGGLSDAGGALLSGGRDLVRDVPLVGGLLGQESTEEQAIRSQKDASNAAIAAQQEAFNKAQSYLDPYRQMGENVFLGKEQFDSEGKSLGRSGGLSDRIQGGEFLQDKFSYGGEQPNFSYSGQQPDAFKYGGPTMASSVNYSGQQPDAFNYGGAGQQGKLDYQGQQQGQLDYQGGPIDRSIESYMKDDPSLAWQQEQMEKAINRQGAAKGRWGGGATGREMMRETAGLLSQDYGNRFNRASQERLADVGTEIDQYGRSLTGLGLQNQAEQSNYNRAGMALDRSNMAEQSDYLRSTGEYGMGVDREQRGYDRAYTDTNLANQAAQDAYNRQQYGYESGVDRERDAYGRATQQYGFDVNREQNQYGRATDDYARTGANMQNKLNQLTGLANYGPQMSQSMSNAMLGHATNINDMSMNQANAEAAARLSGGNTLTNLLNLGKGGMDIYSGYKSTQQQGKK